MYVPCWNSVIQLSLAAIKRRRQLFSLQLFCFKGKQAHAENRISVHNHSCSTSKLNIPEDSHWTLPSTFSSVSSPPRNLGKRRDLPKYFQSGFCDLRGQGGAQCVSGRGEGCVSALTGMYFKNELQGYHISRSEEHSEVYEVLCCTTET